MVQQAYVYKCTKVQVYGQIIMIIHLPNRRGFGRGRDGSFCTRDIRELNPIFSASHADHMRQTGVRINTWKHGLDGLDSPGLDECSPMKRGLFLASLPPKMGNIFLP